MDVFVLAAWYSCTEGCHRPGVVVFVLATICILVQLHRGLSQTRGGRVCTGRHMHLGTAAQRAVTDQGWPCLYWPPYASWYSCTEATDQEGWPCLHWPPYASWYSCTEGCHRPGVAVSVLATICILVQLHRGHRPGGVAVFTLAAICILVQLHRGLSQTRRGGRAVARSVVATCE